MAVESRVRYAKSGDVHVAYAASGAGALDLLLVPDGAIPIEAMGEQPNFARFIERLEAFSRVIRYDRRGTGLSDPPAPGEPPTLEQWTDDATIVLDAVGSGRTALLGMAEGGFLVSLLAAMHPERVHSLVLVNATPGISAEPFRAWGSAAGALDRLKGLVDSSWGETDWGIELFAPSAASDHEYAEWLRRAVRRAMSPAIAAALFDVAYQSDIRDILPVISVPTLVIHRSGNAYLTIEHGRYLAEHIPGATLVEVPGEDHVPYLGDQEPILGAIEEFLTGTRASRTPVRMLTTVLFTDIVGSSETASRLGDGPWGDLLREHHEIVRRELSRFRGREVDTAGDGFFAVFDGPAQAVRCACAIQEAVRPLGIDVRAGVHVGECEVVDGKPAGIAVVIGSRLASLGTGSEVLVSGTVRDLAAGSGIRFDDRGATTLKGVSDEWRIFRVDPSSLAN